MIDCHYGKQNTEVDRVGWLLERVGLQFLLLHICWGIFFNFFVIINRREGSEFPTPPPPPKSLVENFSLVLGELSLSKRAFMCNHQSVGQDRSEREVENPEPHPTSTNPSKNEKKRSGIRTLISSSSQFPIV